MVEVARTRSKEHSNVEYVLADAASWEFPSERFDCAASIMTLDHLPLGPMLAKMRDALRPGGTLLVLDLYRARTIADHVVGALAVPASKVITLAKTDSSSERQSPELRRAWEEHGSTDVYLTLGEVRRACDTELPKAAVRRHLLWRYTVVWRKPVLGRGQLRRIPLLRVWVNKGNRKGQGWHAPALFLFVIFSRVSPSRALVNKWMGQLPLLTLPAGWVRSGSRRTEGGFLCVVSARGACSG
jgi:SAM-dependent methyltransferase